MDEKQTGLEGKNPGATLRLQEQFGENHLYIMEGLLKNSPFHPAVEQYLGRDFSVLYAALVSCLPQELGNAVNTYPWRRSPDPELLRDLAFSEGGGEFPLFIVNPPNMRKRYRGRSLLISNRAVYLSGKKTYLFSDLHSNYFGQEKKTLYLRNFGIPHVWERSATQLIEACMLVCTAPCYSLLEQPPESVSPQFPEGAGKQASAGAAKQAFAAETQTPSSVQEIRLDLKAALKPGALLRMIDPTEKNAQKRLENLERAFSPIHRDFPFQTLIFAYDTSSLRNGKAGLAFTTEGIFIKDIALSAFLRYEEISHLHANKQDLLINGHRFFIADAAAAECLRQTVNTLVLNYGKRGDAAENTASEAAAEPQPAPDSRDEPAPAATPASVLAPELLEPTAPKATAAPHPAGPAATRALLDGRLTEENAKRILYPDDPRHKARLNAMVARIAKEFPAFSGTVRLALDSSVMLQGKSGMVFTEDGFYAFELGPAQFTAYKDVQEISLKRKRLYIGGERVQLFGDRDLLLVAAACAQQILQENQWFSCNVPGLHIDREALTAFWPDTER